MTVDQFLSLFAQEFHTSLLPGVLNILISISPVFLAVILFIVAWNLWVDYIRSFFILNKKTTVLELKLPKDTFKSPLSMETVLAAMHNTADGSKFDQYWKGKTRPWFSLELISIEGQVKFMIWLEESAKAVVMGALYAQFPGIEIYEREDYTKSVHFDPETTRIHGVEYIKAKSDSFPIKTYIDYGLDKDPKEEFKIDPITHLIEFLGNVKPNQQVWLQIIIRAHKKDQRKPGHLIAVHDAWKADAETQVNKLLNRDPKTRLPLPRNKDDKTSPLIPALVSKSEERAVDAIDRAQSKLPFDVGIRALYIAPVDSFDGAFFNGGMIYSLKQFNSETLNGFKPNVSKWHPSIGDAWTDYRNYRKNKYSKLVLMAYKRRSFFYPPFVGKSVVLNAEELATIYHFPGSVAATPNLERVPSKKSSAPGNIPI